MNKYILNNKIINATEKAFNLIYKAQGFTPYKGNKNNKSENSVLDESKNVKEIASKKTKETK